MFPMIFKFMGLMPFLMIPNWNKSLLTCKVHEIPKFVNAKDNTVSSSDFKWF